MASLGCSVSLDRLLIGRFASTLELFTRWAIIPLLIGCLSRCVLAYSVGVDALRGHFLSENAICVTVLGRGVICLMLHWVLILTLAHTRGENWRWKTRSFLAGGACPKLAASWWHGRLRGKTLAWVVALKLLIHQVRGWFLCDSEWRRCLSCEVSRWTCRLLALFRLARHLDGLSRWVLDQICVNFAEWLYRTLSLRVPASCLKPHGWCSLLFAGWSAAHRRFH